MSNCKLNVVPIQVFQFCANSSLLVLLQIKFVRFVTILDVEVFNNLIFKVFFTIVVSKFFTILVSVFLLHNLS